jgi:hypothetical protein
LEEALHRIEQPDPPPSAVDRLADMRIDILERLRRSDAAQAVRWERFARTLSETLLDEYLARVPERERATTLAQATQIAGRHRDVHSALSLLSIRAPQAAADLVLERHHRLSGDVYFVLRPAAERLADISPLASILLYRKMADAVLARSQWQHYGHAVGDIAAAEKLAPAVRDWHVHATQDAYRTRLSAEHRQKRAFWERMRKAGLAHPR